MYDSVYEDANLRIADENIVVIVENVDHIIVYYDPNFDHNRVDQ